MAVPQRICIGCRQVKAKKDLIRIVQSPAEGIITVDPHGRGTGRGAYICPNIDCLDKALQPERLSKAFRINPGSRIGQENIDKLKQNLLELIEFYHY
jgi:predicted RNA-binding protein YlxR (DUF448 family)